MKQIVDQIAEQFSLTKKTADAVVRSFLSEVQERTITDGKLRTPFGTFKLKSRPARTCKNPKTGAVVDVPAKKVITFSASSDTKTAVNV